VRRRIKSSAPNTSMAVFSHFRPSSSAKTVSRYCVSAVSNLLCTSKDKSCRHTLKTSFGVVRVHMLSIEFIVELLKLEQILVCQAKRMHLILLTDETEKHYSSPFITCLDGCLLILYASEFAEHSIVLAQESAGPE